MIDIRDFDPGTFLAYRVLDARTLPDVPIVAVALPGAKAAIPHDRLLAHQDAGRDESKIVERINRAHDLANVERLAEHRRWVAGPYAGMIAEMREREAEQQAREMRRAAALERFLAAEEDDSAGRP